MEAPAKYKFGIYNHTQNPTYKIINNDLSFDYNSYTYDAAMGKFDTEYDLYQYNFMGQSGRFYVVKNPAGSFVVEKLDKNNVQIICQREGSTDVINSFTIVDDKGIRYIFDAKEKSEKNTTNVKIGLTSGGGNLNFNTEMADHFTSFHLVRITDQNNINLVEFNYDLSSMVKYNDTPNKTTRNTSNVSYTNTTMGQNPDNSMLGIIESQVVYTAAQTKLITSIDVKGKGMIYFNYEQGRQDTNYLEPANLYRLKSVQTNFLGRPTSLFTEKYMLDYDYSSVTIQAFNGIESINKLLLKKVTKVVANGQNSEYVLDYNTSNSILKKDDWGYYKNSSVLSLDNDIVTDVIKSITYPTKGKVIFDFDENDFSYNPTPDATITPVTGYNTTNPFEFSIAFGQFNNNYKQNFFTIQSAQHVNFDFWLGNLIYYNWKIQIFKKNADNTFSPVVYEFAYSSQACNKPQPSNCFVLNPNPNGEIISEFHPNVYLEPGTYYASLTGNFGSSNAAPTLDTFVAHTGEPVYVDMKIYKGGGIRIKNISYYENPSSNVFSKKYLYSYKNLEDIQRSSGALVFPKPVFNLQENYSYQNFMNNATMTYSANFDTETNFNILPVQKTQGGDVGYKYVTVEQVDGSNNKKGRTEYKFRSPIDYPNEATVVISLQPVPIPNQDYLRGQLVSEKKFDSANNILTETITDYVSSSFEKNDGIKIKDNYTYNMISQLFSFNSYQDMVNHGYNAILTTSYKSFEKFGITLPVQKVEKSYFYKNGIQSIVTSTTDNIYNTRDYPTSVTQSFADGETSITTYKYAHEKNDTRLITANMIGIPLETESKKNNKTVAKVETLYSDGSHYSPTSITSYDFNNIAQTEVTYDRYDSKGNLLQYTTRDGIPTTIIWGYNSTQPIAKIVGHPYSLISGLAGAIISASDNDALNPSNEAALITALDNFRNLPQLKEFQITTYTYDSLIGVTSITPPSGIREIYKYDSANRLENIRDINGKLLKEFKYNYKH